MIQYLTSHVIYGRSFIEKICAKIDFDEVMIRFKRGEDPLTFDSDPVTVAIVVIVVLNCSLHAEAAFTIPPESEIIVLGKLNAELPLKKTVFGLVVSRNDFPHCYSIFGASELPVRMVNPSAHPVKIFRKARLGDFESLGIEVKDCSSARHQRNLLIL